MSTVKNLNPRGAALPDNPRWVSVDCSDGDAKRWPTNTIANPDAEGYVNYMEPMSIDHDASVKWRCLIGQSLAEMLKYPDLDSKSWVLKDWPTGYKFYCHKKGVLPNRVRHDLYLIGSKLVGKFRSPQEFIPHAYWLITDRGENRNRCECKYCAKRPQREVTDAFGLPSQRGSGGGGGGYNGGHGGGHGGSSQGARVPTASERMAARRREKMREAPHATVHRAPKMMKLPKGPSQIVAPEREGDLRGLTGKKRQWAREGEVVWAKMEQPIAGTFLDGREEEISFWPGVVEEIRMKPIISNKGKQSVLKDATNGTLGAPGSGPEENGSGSPWTVKHVWLYKIRLLVSGEVIVCSDEQLLPYMAYSPSKGLLQAIISVDVNFDIPLDEPAGMMIITADGENTEDAEERTFKSLGRLNPFPPERIRLSPAESTERFKAAAGPYLMAFKIATNIAKFWTPSHPWECRLMVPSTAMLSAVGYSTSTSSVLSREESRQLASYMFGNQASETQQGPHPAPSFNVQSQTRFQGLWWGPERIWMGDLVRLKVPRSHFAPDGAPNIKRPSGAEAGSVIPHPNPNLTQPQVKIVASDDAAVLPQEQDMQVDEAHPQVPAPDVDQGEAMDVDLPPAIEGASLRESRTPEQDIIDVDGESDGAASRGLFMQIDGIFVARGTLGRGVGNECRLAGMIYELADEDWESEDEAPPAVTVAGEKPVSKGKAIATPLSNIKFGSSQPQRTDDTPTSSQAAPVALPQAPLQAPLQVDEHDSSSALPKPEKSLPQAGTSAPLRNTAGAVVNGNGHMGPDGFNAAPVLADSGAAVLPDPLTTGPTVDFPRPTEQAENISHAGEPAISTLQPLVLSEKAKGKQPEKAPSTPTPKIFNPGNPSLSSPLSPLPASYPLPAAPQTYKFRPILKQSFEAVVPLTLLSGRYYPGILSKSLMRPYVAAAREDPGAHGNDAYWALECLDSGVFNSVDPVTKISSRFEMVKRAEVEARRELMAYWREKARRAAMS